MLYSASDGFSIEDLYLAYRKAKAEAFYENTHFHALAFAVYEQALDKNLRRLLVKLNGSSSHWTRDPAMIAGFSYAPKSVENPEGNNDDAFFYRFLDPIEEWRRRWPPNSLNLARAQFRLLITPTVEFQIVSALWILAVGHLYDSVLDPAVAYANRVRRRRPMDQHGVLGELNLDCAGLFPPYFSAYSKWRENGLEAMRNSLVDGQRILAITMDLRSFYHRVGPRFLLRSSFLEVAGLQLSDFQLRFTKNLIDALETWYSSTPDYQKRPEGAIPVGLSCSKIIANVLLAELDRQVLRRLRPIYYGRYVDDVFLVLSSTERAETAASVMERLTDAMPEVLRFERLEDEEVGLRLTFPYAEDSDLVFAGAKQKIFNLSGQHGLDLVRQIGAQIREQSSEHRLLPTVPATSVEMASRALLAQSSASLEADAIRKADVVSVRRLGLSLLLRDVEAYARDLHPKEWESRRQEFYGLIHRHILTPIGYFDFFAYTHRALGLMIACGDLQDAIQLLRKLTTVIGVLEETTTAGTGDKRESDICRQYYAHALNQVILQATTVAGFRWPRRLMQVFNTLRLIDPDVAAPTRIDKAKRLSRDLLYSDWGRRPYREFWLSGGARKIPNPPVPSSLSLRRLFRLGAIRAFRKSAGLRLPYWPPVVFPTRPLSLSEMTLAAPELLTHTQKLRAALFALRGARARNQDGIGMTGVEGAVANKEVLVDARQDERYRVAVPSYLTTDQEWAAAADGTPSLTLARYERLRRLINRILREARSDYVIFPECSVPLKWALSIAFNLAQRKMSFIAGLEYRVTPNGVRNDAFLSLATDWPWHSTSVLMLQPKGAPAYDERRRLYKHGRKRLYRPAVIERNPPVYIHGGLAFSVLLCSDLTNLAHRGRLQGAIDALLILEWNRDIETFSSLVEATANDLHAYVIQSNNRRYGDSRIRIPKKENYQRDVVRVRGGLHDYFVIAELDIQALRKFQRTTPTTSKGPFKPIPIGYAMSDRRKVAK